MTDGFDLILAGGRVATMDDNDTVIEDAMIGVSGGVLSYVGPRDDELVGPESRVLHTDGSLIIPGLINIHTHAMLCMLRGQAEDMGFAPAYTKGVPQGVHITREDAYALARLGALEALLAGSTFLWDSYVHADVAIEAIASLGLRLSTSSRIHDVDLTALPDGRRHHQRGIGERLLNDTLTLAERYNGKTENRISVSIMLHAPDTCSVDLLRDARDAAERQGLLLHTHLAQSASEVNAIRERTSLTPIEFLDNLGLLSDRLTAAHCIFVGDSDLALMQRAGMNVAHIPKGNLTWGSYAPTSKMRRADINLALGTDNMHGDMVEVMRWALNVGRLQEGSVTEFWQPLHVLYMATRGGAKALGLEHTLGSIEIGKAADVVVLDLDQPHLTPSLNPVGTLVHTGRGGDVRTVLVAGEPVVVNGSPTRCDVHTVVEEGRDACRRVWARAQ